MPCPDCSHDADYERVELVWPGKNRPVERVSLPFQTIERVNDVRRSQDAQAQLVGASVGGKVNEPISQRVSNRGNDVASFDVETGRVDLPEWWSPGWRNRLIWGDNKLVLSSLLGEFAGKVSLIYIDPPFATGADFSYKTQVGDADVEKLPSILEEVAYRDMWHAGVHSFVSWIYPFIGQLNSLLSPDGSFYLHCDPNISHHLKMLCESVFGADNFRNEITWKRHTSVHGSFQHDPKQYGSITDAILYYAKSSATPIRPYKEMSSKEIEEKFTLIDENGRRYYDDSAHIWNSPNMGARPNQCYEWRGYRNPHPSGWRLIESRLEEEYRKGNIVILPNGKLQRRKYVDEFRGTPLGNLWIDIPPAMGRERTNYPTQKSEALLRRIINSSTKEGDLVLDCFVGSGTTAAVAEKLGRRWVGVDIGRFAIQTTRKRLLDIHDCRPFEVQNLGRYERSHWQAVGSRSGNNVAEYIDFILDLHTSRPMPGQFHHLHGIREGVAVHVGATDAPVSADELRSVVAECTDNGFAAVDVLGWEWEMGLNPALRDELRQVSGVGIRLLNIPREILDQRNIDAGPVNFFELSVADVRIGSPYELAVQIELSDFIPAVDEYMQQRLSSVPTEWTDWIDYWSVDFEYDGEIFVNQWQSYRTRADRSLNLVSDPHEYEGAGSKTVVVKVIDIFGHDTTVELNHEAGGAS